jgi:pimeloyl-ACP methyl ester carboxylesterase
MVRESIPVTTADRTLDPPRRPSYLLLALEGPRAAGELAALAAFRPLLAKAPKGDGHPVLVLPGLRADDRSTLPLRRYLRRLGYHVHGWGLGTNLGPSDLVVDGLRQRVRALHDRYDQPLSLVGWSLGGIYAREIARVAPERVRQVITLGSPFREIPGEESHPAAFIRAFRGREPRRPPDRGPLTIPATAIFTRTDGIVPWRASQGEDGPRSESIEIVSSHCGLGHHPAALWAIADRLAQPPGAWQRFRPRGGWAPLFPKVAA